MKEYGSYHFNLGAPASSSMMATSQLHMPRDHLCWQILLAGLSKFPLQISSQVSGRGKAQCPILVASLCGCFPVWLTWANCLRGGQGSNACLSIRQVLRTCCLHHGFLSHSTYVFKWSEDYNQDKEILLALETRQRHSNEKQAKFWKKK